MAQSELVTIVEPVCKRQCDQMNFELVDVELVKEGAGRYLRIYISKEGGVDLNDCEAYHRAIQDKLDAVSYDFLEVCSPGIDRPFKRPGDYDKHVGEDVEIRLYRAIDGKKQYEGALVGLENDIVTLDAPEGMMAFELKNIALARPLITFDDDELGAED